MKLLQYNDILQYFLLQYNTIHLKKISIYCTLQYIAMFVVFKVLNFQLLHCKSDWTSCNPECTVQFLTILDGFSFLLLLKNYISVWNVLYYNPVTHCNILQYTQMQYTIWHWPCCFIPSVLIFQVILYIKVLL